MTIGASFRTRAGIAVAILAALAIGATALNRVVDRRINRVIRETTIPVTARARALHARLTIVDLHADTLLWDRDPLARHTRGLADVPRLLEGNVALQVFSAVTYVPYGETYARPPGGTLDWAGGLAILNRWPPRTWLDPYERALHQARRFDRAVERSNGALVPVRSTADLDGRDGRGRLAGLLALEGAYPIGRDVAALDRLHAAGFRMLGLAHLCDGPVAGSLHGTVGGGLTPLGREVVQRAEELGMILDLAHTSRRAFDDAIALASRPVVVSHGGVRGTCDRPRNLDDAQLRAVAANGGVVGIGYWEEAVCGRDPRAVARAIRHAVSIAGIDHVALGSDFDGAVAAPFDAAGLAVLTQVLLDEGFAEDEIVKIAGGNALRVLRSGLEPRRPAGDQRAGASLRKPSASIAGTSSTFTRR